MRQKEPRISWSDHGQWATSNIARWIALLWLIEFVNIGLGNQLIELGIQPRTLAGLYGIPLWVFVHASVTHLLVNMTPLIVLGWFLGLSGPRVFYRVSLMVTLIGGTSVWLLGRSSYHLGASGLVFGYFGYLVASALRSRGRAEILIAVGVIFYYGGMVVGIIPSGGPVSWEGHLFGLAAGVYAALGSRGRAR